MTDPDTIVAILNPAARSSRARNLQRTLPALSARVDVRTTSGSGDARRLAREAALRGVRIVVAVGGDGTMNEVAGGLLDAAENGSEAMLGVLPVGTMNVLARELGIPLELERAMEVVEAEHCRRVDVWEANGSFFLQLAGVGLDAEVIRTTSTRDKRLLGPLSYAKAGLGVLSRKAPQFRVETEEGLVREGESLLLGNGCFYGGPIAVFPAARNTDGLLDAVLIHRKRTGAVAFAKAVMAGDYARAEGVEYFQTRGLRVTSLGDEEIPFEVDGELAGVTPLEIRLRAATGLRVLAPPRPGGKEYNPGQSSSTRLSPSM